MSSRKQAVKRVAVGDIGKILPKHEGKQEIDYDFVIPYLIRNGGRSGNRTWLRGSFGEKHQHQKIENDTDEDHSHHGASTDPDERLTN